jgi:hypothetical protein
MTHDKLMQMKIGDTVVIKDPDPEPSFYGQVGSIYAITSWGVALVSPRGKTRGDAHWYTHAELDTPES